MILPRENLEKIDVFLKENEEKRNTGRSKQQMECFIDARVGFFEEIQESYRPWFMIT